MLLAPNIASITAEGSGDAAAAAAAGGAGGAAEDDDEGPERDAPDACGEEEAAAGGTAECPASALAALAAEKEVPLVYALSRQRMGKVGGWEEAAGRGMLHERPNASRTVSFGCQAHTPGSRLCMLPLF